MGFLKNAIRKAVKGTRDYVDSLDLDDKNTDNSLSHQQQPPASNVVYNGPVLLTKDTGVNLNKLTNLLTDVSIGLGWKENDGAGADFDLDASLFMLGNNGKALNSQGLIYFNNLQSSDGSINHLGDNLTGGDGAGDEETIIVKLQQVPTQIATLKIVVNIYQANARRQHFGDVSNAYIRIVDNNTKNELARFNLSDTYGGETSIIFGELVRSGNDWDFNAIGKPTSGELGGLCRMFGVSI